MKKNESKIIQVPSEKDFETAAIEILEYAKDRKTFALSGDLGAGKTTFTQYFCKSLGVTDLVTSPTFSLVNEYAFLDKSGRTCRFFHLDLYRLNNLQEAIDIGIEDYIYGDDYCFVEWPELIAHLLPENTVYIKINIMPDLGRKILLL